MISHFFGASAALALTWQRSDHQPGTATTSAVVPAFTYDSNSFFLHGEPFVIIGGQMDPQRIPPEYWRDRLVKARAMGLNTILSYVYWNLLEPQQGVWKDDEDSNDIAGFFRIAQQEGLHVILRPGPYACGEREWGAFPAWLSNVPELVVRSSSGPFLNLSRAYIEHLASSLAPLQVTEGGPVLMVQVENEYGSYGDDHEYMRAMRDILLENFDVPLYTNDGGTNWTLAGGEVPGVLAEVDGDPSSAFAARDEFVTDPSELGPLFDGEYYTYAPDTWGSSNAHSTTDGNPDQVAHFVQDLEYVLGANNSISLYMFHGGTNFGWSNGGLWKNYTASFTTSYDYGAPLSEDGRTTDLYFTLRDTIQKYTAGSIPEPPANIPLLSIPNITLSAKSSLFDIPFPKTTNTSPLTMEDLGQSYGLVLYEHQATQAAEGLLSPGDRPRDRVIVYINGTRIGVIDSTYAEPNAVSLALAPGDTLQLLVENLGRVDYYSLESGLSNELLDPHKGVVGNVAVGGTVLENWAVTSMPLETVPSLAASANASVSGQTPAFYSGTFVLGSNYTDPAQLDTFVAVPTGVKGVVWVNGFNLGRYWVVGPQQSLYLPGTLLRAGERNEIVVLELEPGNQEMISMGESERTWGNHPDPDYG